MSDDGLPGGTKRYGIRITLSKNNPMRLPHLLGEDWELCKWFETETERDRVYQHMRSQVPYNRLGDEPAQILTKIED